MTPTPSSTTAAAGTRRATPAEIAEALVFDDESKEGGYSNRERVAFVLSMFGADTIDFTEEFDYGPPLCSPYPAIVEAWRQLSILQHYYYTTLYLYQWIDDEEFERISNYLHVVTQNLDWHIQCLYSGKYKPLIVIPDTPIH